MRFACLPFLLLASVAMGQVAENVTPTQTVVTTSSTGPGTLAVPPAVNVPANSPVITVSGICDSPVKDAKDKPHAACKTVLTREQFDALADAIQPHMDPLSKVQLAASYPRILAMQREFRKLDLENDSKVKLALEFAKMRTEADEAEKALKVKAADVSEAEIQKYYTQNSATFQEIELERIYVPFSQSAQPTAARHGKPDASMRRAEVAAKQADDPMKANAEQIRTRAVAGENFDSLQADAFRMAGMLATPPDANMGKRIADEMSQDRRPLFSLGVGEVSQVLDGPNGFYIYKVVSKDIRPLDEVRSKITTTVSEEKFAELKDKVEQSVKAQFNTAYFPKDPLTVAAPAVSSAKLNFGSPLGARNVGKGARSRTSVMPYRPSSIPPGQVSAEPLVQTSH